MSRRSRLSLAAILSSALVFSTVATGFAQSGIFVDHNDLVFLPGQGTGPPGSVKGEGHRVTLPGAARIGGDSGPRGDPQGAASFSSSSSGATLGVSGGSSRDDECEDIGAAPLC